MEQSTNPIPSMDTTFLLQQAPKENGVAVDAFSRQLLGAMKSFRDGDFSARLPQELTGVEGKIADTFNEIVAANQRMAKQLEHVGQVVGREGKTRQRVKFDLSSGSWADMEGSVNTLIDDLLWPTREVTRAVAAVAQGAQIVRVHDVKATREALTVWQASMRGAADDAAQ